MQQLRRHHGTLSRPAAGFTLVELMISIVMVLMLVAGINAVFQAATKTTGTGMAVEEMTRSMRASERLFTRDFSHIVPAWEMPCLTIFSMQQFAFRNRSDMNNDPDGNANTVDLNGDGMETNKAIGEYVYPFIYNDRNHRVDRIGFFARDSVTPFERQTGNLAPLNSSDPSLLIASDKSEEAYIWYGHLRLPKRAENPQYNDYFNPGQPDPGNINNRFSDDWCFGRAAILLKNLEYAPNDVEFIRRSTVWLSPLRQGSFSRYADPLIKGRWAIEQSRYDLADTTIREFRENVVEAFASGNFNRDRLLDAMDYRFHCKPWAMRGTKQGDSIRMDVEMALTVPFVQRGVSQFVAPPVSRDNQVQGATILSHLLCVG